MLFVLPDMIMGRMNVAAIVSDAAPDITGSSSRSLSDLRTSQEAFASVMEFRILVIMFDMLVWFWFYVLRC